MNDVKGSYESKTLKIPQTIKDRAVNAFPDILFFASGKVSKEGIKAKFRIRLSDAGDTIKRWSETVAYTDDFGNMFDGALFTNDDFQNQLDVIFEVKINNGEWQKLEAFDVVDFGGGPLIGQALVYEDGNGASGTVGLIVNL